MEVVRVCDIRQAFRKRSLARQVWFKMACIRRMELTIYTCSDLIALGTPGYQDDDVWCLDTRGILSLAVKTQSYQRLGLVGKRLPWKGCDDMYSKYECYCLGRTYRKR